VTAQRGFSLVELVVSLGVLAILLGAMTSSLALAMRVAPSSTDKTSTTVGALSAVERLAAELETSRAILSAGADGVAFEIVQGGATRGISYQWPGPGEPLLRSVDGSTPRAVTPPLFDFSLAWTIRTDTLDENAPLVDGPEQLLVRIDDSIDGSTKNTPLKPDKAHAQSFTPSLPADAQSWRCTLVQFMARPHAGTDGIITLGVHEVDAAGAPTGASIESATALESELIEGQWHDVPFPGAATLDVNREYALAFTGTGSGTVAELTILDKGTLQGVYTVGLPGSFTVQSEKNIFLSVWGRAQIPDPDWTAPTVDRLVRVRIEASTSPDGAALITTGAPTLNEPEFPEAGS